MDKASNYGGDIMTEPLYETILILSWLCIGMAVVCFFGGLYDQYQRAKKLREYNETVNRR